MPDVMVKAVSGNDIQNGRIVVSTTGGSDIQTISPPINVVMTSGEMVARWDDRFMFHYGNVPSGIGV